MGFPSISKDYSRGDILSSKLVYCRLFPLTSHAGTGDQGALTLLQGTLQYAVLRNQHPIYKMENQNNFPYTFNERACKTCSGNCCRGFSGYVWIQLEELEKIASTMEMDPVLFSRQYLRRVNGRLSLQERFINGEHICCFFDPIESQCTIYQSRPVQCRTFPFWDQFKKDTRDLFLECPEKILNIPCNIYFI